MRTRPLFIKKNEKFCKMAMVSLPIEVLDDKIELSSWERTKARF
jgi:hypothetical protein